MSECVLVSETASVRLARTTTGEDGDDDGTRGGVDDDNFAAAAAADSADSARQPAPLALTGAHAGGRAERP